MNCYKCGNLIPAGVKFCGSCGAGAPLSPNDFHQSGERVRALFAQRKKSVLSQQEFQAEIQKTILKDPQGGSWLYNPDLKGWQWYDGAQWQPRDPYTRQFSPGKKTGGSPSVLIGVLGGAGALILIGLFLFFGWKGGWLGIGPRQSHSVAAVIYALEDQQASLSVYIGSPDQKPMWVEQGLYYIEAMDQDGNAISMEVVNLADGKNGGDFIDFPRAFDRHSNQLDDRQKEQLDTLIAYILLADNARLTYTGIISDDFRVMPYAAASDIQMSALDPLFALYEDLDSDGKAALAAADAFQQRALDAASMAGLKYDDGKPGLMSPPRFVNLINRLREFIGLPADAQTRAQQEIVKAFAAMNEFQQAEAMEAVEDTYGDVSRTPEEFIRQVQSGELNDRILRIRRDLYNDGNYQGALHVLNPGVNRPCLNTAHEEGSKLVEAGANLYVEVIKEVLDAQFPGIKKGVDYAEKIDKWAGYVNDLLTDPQMGLEKFTLDQIKDLIKSTIEDELKDLAPGINPDELSDLAGIASEHIVKQVQANVRHETAQGNVIVQIIKQTQMAAATPTEEDFIFPTYTLQPTLNLEPTATERFKPDYSWIEPYVATVITELYDIGYDMDAVNVFADTLRACLREAADYDKTAEEGISKCQSSVDQFKKNPTPTPELRYFGGSWHSNILCGEDDDPKYRWVVNLSQNSMGKVSGSINFHACPGGGAAYYSVSGQATSSGTLSLSGTRTSGRGSLGGSAASNVNFTIEYYGAPRPNYAP